ncbi:extracellular solute-binding protein family 1 [Gloeocapsa sp. PCC 7428]|uniref:ABC transporter substrate-binding protein n=1 Tax=Gloeocapsa sp. PCC 7428 TaxID=1173026 RepID=UPI0002A5C488|nr:ABC transporter substrate-binding protein [Gloeocapsa sp. PCC 7428]AFZ30976.1 extracellular solute-binding protein family 1 [Gloeocapsa sp. PCC 7428]
MKNKPLMFILSICIATLVAFFFPDSAQAKNCTLRIIGWEGYMDQSFTKPFEQKYGCKVVASYAGSSDEMYAKIKASKGKTYDLVTASGDLTKRLYDAGLIEPLDLSKVPNYQNLLPTFQKPPYNTFDGQPYGVSIAWGPDFLIYDKTVIKSEPQTWKILYEPQYKGKVSLPDYPIFNADIALWNGYPNIFELSKEKLEQEIKPKLFPLRPQVRKFWNSQGELAQLFLNKEIALAWGWPVAIEELKRANFPVAATIPQEGTTGWSDSWMMIKNSPNQDIAYAWMDYMLTGTAQKQMTEITGYWPVSSQILPLLTTEQQAELHLDDVANFYSKIHFWETVPNYDNWVALWNEFRGQ